MNNSDNIFVKLHRIDPDGTVHSVQYEEDFLTHQLVSKTPIPADDINFDTSYAWNYVSDNKINLNYRYLEPDDSSITVIKIGGVDDINPMNYATEITTILNDPGECKQLTVNGNNVPKQKKDSKIPNIPTMIRCQNCDTNFPTKYQYQRHQCEFNAEKVVLKPDADIKDIDKGMRIKYDCSICGKQFVSKNNLERHQTSHDSTKKNVCEHCNKQFVSENRLRIHKENHCKKAGDISKFYRSDVAVWKCLKCNQVFATPATANRHAENCMESNDNQQWIDKQQLDNNEDESKNEQTEENCTKTDRYVEKVLTELLLQCEFCNRTYAEKHLLLLHQRTHTTEVNYECVMCKEVFDSYTSAAKHWLTKCSDEANLFYLPKLTYCEYCDRTFKSHEILYTHKIKKKHYTQKVHRPSEVAQNDVKNEEKGTSVPENKDVIVKLIEDVLTTLSASLNKYNDSENGQGTNEFKETDQVPDASNEIEIKTEIISSQTSNNTTPDVLETGDEMEKKKRGRKRKWPKQTSKTKRTAAVVEQGFKYQCERCMMVWDCVSDLEMHRDKEHASNYSCEECGQVRLLYLLPF